MGVYIKDMNMPTSCNDCPMCYDMMQCSIADPIINFFKVKKEFDFCAERHPKCPLVPVPPHGRLIDADTLTVKHGWLDNFDNTHTHIQFVYANEINYTPTIIESEEEE